MSAGKNDVNDLVEVGGVSAPIASPLHKLDESLIFEEVQMALDGSHRTAKDPRQTIHGRPAEATLRVRVVREHTQRAYGVGRNPRLHKLLDLRNPGESLLCRHRRLLLEVLAAVRSGVQSTKAAVALGEGTGPPLFLCLCL